MKTFEQYLIDRHAEQYTGLDDSMPDDYCDWESNLDGQELIEMAEKWGAAESATLYKIVGEMVGALEKSKGELGFMIEEMSDSVSYGHVNEVYEEVVAVLARAKEIGEGR